MMPHKKTLSLRTIQEIANTIELMKQRGYPAKWDASTQYWMARLIGFCESITKRITETRNNLIKTYGTQNEDGTYNFKGDNDAKFNEEIKDLLDTEETIRFPEFKASSFVKLKDGKVTESLVPIEFWEVFSSLIVLDVEEFKMEEEKTE